MHCYEVVETAVGRYWIACGPRGVTRIVPADMNAETFENEYRKVFGTEIRRGNVGERFKQALMRAAAGEPFMPVPVDLSCLSTFQAKVLRELQKVPRGKVRTYAWLARRAGSPLAARAVGNTMARNPIPFLIPCHRVVPSGGGVGRFGLGKGLKRELLRREGVQVDRM